MLRLFFTIYLYFIAVYTFAQSASPFSAGAFFEATAFQYTFGVRGDYHFNPYLIGSLEIRKRDISIGSLETPCLILNGVEYPQLADLNPEEERITLRPTVDGSAPFAIAITAQSPGSIAGFVRLRAELARLDFSTLTMRQVAFSLQDTSTNRAFVNREESIATTRSTVLGGSAQVGLRFTGERELAAFRLYVSLDNFLIDRVQTTSPVPGYPTLAPLRIELRNHMTNPRLYVGCALMFRFGA